MKRKVQFGRGSEAGSALLIAIFALMLISVVGLALVVSTGTDSALAGNYRNSTSAYYAAVAGLEEARGRLLTRSTQYIGDTNVAFVTSDIHNVLYILNPINGETVNPLDSSSAYPDTEYGLEFPTWTLAGANVQTMASVAGTPGLPGPLYKWVRINAVSEQALNLDLDGGGLNPDPTARLYYNGSSLTSVPPPTGSPGIEITALAVMPDKSKKLLQYVVAQNSIGSQLTSNPFPPPSPPPIPNRDFPAALTLAGNDVVFQGPTSSAFFVNGQDQTPNCSSTDYMVASIGFTNSLDASKANIEAGIPPPSPPTDYRSNYLGYPPGSGSPAPPSPAPLSIQDVSTSMRSNWQTPVGLDAIVQNITANADVVINGNATGNDIVAKAPTMSPSNPMTVVINGNLDFDAWHQTGYGLLLVTGTLYYDPDATWEGIVLVIGQGNFVSTKSGTGGIDGAVFIAKTRDGVGALLPTLGASSFSQTGTGSSGRGINYNSCWINNRFVNGNWVSPGAKGPLTYQVLSFREITQ
jgi:hypothetical protein